jgi:UDP-glucuronate decarboxylase
LRKRILVTGGAGFLGSHLCERLLRDGHDVLCVDNYFSGRRENIIHLLDDHNFEAMRHDVTFPLFVEVDEIYNLACPASPIHYQFDPVQTTKTCVHGAINMLGLAKRVKGKILQASTSEYPRIHPNIRDRGLLGQRQPDWPPFLLRRRQALRRNPVLRLPSPTSAEDPRGADLQYLWPADVAE